jgi:hypothetical protein
VQYCICVMDGGEGGGVQQEGVSTEKNEKFKKMKQTQYFFISNARVL